MSGALYGPGIGLYWACVTVWAVGWALVLLLHGPPAAAPA